MQRRTTHLLLLGAALAAAAAAACSDLQSGPQSTARPPAIRAAMTSTPFTCGVQYTQISTISDSTLANYGEGAFTDTAQVCENWTGNDYQISIQQQGTSYGSAYPETLSVIQYNAGHASGLGTNGASIADTAVGQTSFELANADSSQIQASYVNPYYGVTSSGGDCVTDPTAIICSPNGDRVPTNLSGISANTTPGGGNGITRREIRALVTGTTEIDRAPNGNRRFQKMRKGVETLYEIQLGTDLWVGEEETSATTRSRASMQWEMIRGRYVRTRLDSDTYETVAGHVTHTVATIRISNLLLGGR